MIDEKINEFSKSMVTPKDGENGKDCDMEEVKKMVSDFISTIPLPKKWGGWKGWSDP